MKREKTKKVKTQAAEMPLTATSPRKRKAHYYKLSEADHETIIEGLRHFVSVYQIAAKIGCGYSTLKAYIAAHPELLEVQKDANAGMVEFTQGKLMQKIAAGSLGAMCFFLERKAGWTQHQKIENIGDLPQINIGIIPEGELPDDGLGEPMKLEAKPIEIVRDEEAERKQVEKATNTDPEEVEDADGGEDEGGDDWGDDFAGGEGGGMF